MVSGCEERSCPEGSGLVGEAAAPTLHGRTADGECDIRAACRVGGGTRC